VSLRFMPGLVVRWPLGLALVSWRYLWMTVPLHRVEECGDRGDLPPVLADALVDERSQPIGAGTGRMWHRTFEVCFEDGTLSAAELVDALMADLNAAAPTEVALFSKTEGRGQPLRVGDEFVVRMPGPWNGPVRVVDVSDTSFRLATLVGHLEAGQVEFRARADGQALRFTVETWNRCASRLVELLYTRLRLAKEIQFNMWVRYCLGAAKVAGGRVRGGVRVSTRWLDEEHGLHDACSRERDRKSVV